ncbi:hypothetical protein R6Q57_015062 [Mikania cordata]
MRKSDEQPIGLTDLQTTANRSLTGKRDGANDGKDACLATVVAELAVGIPRENPATVTTQELDRSVRWRLRSIERRSHHFEIV